MRVYAATDIGRVRPINEDSFYAPKPGQRFCAVADGMGGHNAGEVASAIAIRAIEEDLSDSALPAEEALRRAVERANAEIYRASREKEGLSGMGTTITALFLDGKTAHIAQVGDSRAYLIRNRAILQITTDHTLVEEMVLSGLITPTEARNHPKRNYITRALGTSESVEVDLLRLDTRPEDVFLLCSDGLSNFLSEREMLDILLTGMRPEDKLKTLIERALHRGGHDNITALLVTCEEGAK
jgi:serine/threonine protein phosphatase PrpC